MMRATLEVPAKKNSTTSDEETKNKKEINFANCSKNVSQSQFLSEPDSA